jgi:hypothetical protein
MDRFKNLSLPIRFNFPIITTMGITLHMRFELSLLSLLLSGILSAEDQQPNPVKENSETVPSTSDSVRPVTVDTVDGTRIDMLVSSDGKAVTVASQDASSIQKRKKKKHSPLIGNPVDEPLSIGLINISSLALVEDAQPELSNTFP